MRELKVGDRVSFRAGGHKTHDHEGVVVSLPEPGGGRQIKVKVEDGRVLIAFASRLRALDP